MDNNETKPYRELEQRTLLFAKDVIKMCNSSPKNTVNNRLVDQIVRSAASVGSNYREANDAISKKDFLHRLRIARKEAKETSYWLELLQEANPKDRTTQLKLHKESLELRNILSSIINKTCAKTIAEKV